MKKKRLVYYVDVQPRAEFLAKPNVYHWAPFQNIHGLLMLTDPIQIGLKVLDVAGIVKGFMADEANLFDELAICFDNSTSPDSLRAVPADVVYKNCMILTRKTCQCLFKTKFNKPIEKYVIDEAAAAGIVVDDQSTISLA